MKKRKKPLGYNKRSEEQRIYDIRFCADLFLRGYSYREIADALNRDLSARGMGYTITDFREMDEPIEPATDADQANNIHDWLEQTDSDVECPFLNPENEFGMYEEADSPAMIAVCKKYCHVDKPCPCPSSEQIWKNAIAWYV
jgi:hypothetical protein